MAKIHSVNYEKGKLIFWGECNYQLVCLTNGEYSVCELSSPIKYELDQRNAANETEIKLIFGLVNVASTKARCDGERIFIDSELNFCISTKSQYKISSLKGMTLGEKFSHPKGCMTLCYPKNNLSLWDIAKKYGVKPQKLREKNKVKALETTKDIALECINKAKP